MKKLVSFLSNLPVHHGSKVSPQARVKKIVTLLLDATKSESHRHLKNTENEENEIEDSKELQNKTNEIQIVLNQPEASPVSHAKLLTTSQDLKITLLQSNEERKTETRAKSLAVFHGTSLETSEELLEDSKETQTQVSDTNDFGETGEQHCLINSISSLSETKSEPEVITLLGHTKLPARHTDLQQLQKMLRSRFPIPWNVTPSEKYLLGRLLLMLKSRRPRKSSVWKISKLNVDNREKLYEHESSAQPGGTTEPATNPFFKPSQDCEANCDRSTSPASAQSALTPEKSSSSEPEESFLSCITPQEDSLDPKSSTRQEDPFEKLKRLNVNKTAESELTMSDVELMEEMENTLRRLEKEREEETLNKSADLLDDPLPCTNSLLEMVPPTSAIDEHKLDKSTKSLNTKEKHSARPSSSERRRSSRLAGLPALPLIFTQQPLPCKRKSPTPSSASKASPQGTSNQEEKSKVNQLEAIKEDSTCESASKKPRYNAHVSLDLNLTPNLPKKPVRRRIVSLNPDPYLFIASDEELVAEVARKDLEQSQENQSKKSASSQSLFSPDVVELSPCSDEDMEVVFSQLKTEEKSKENLNKESVDVMPITPESETGSYRSSSSLKLSLAHDEKSNDSIELVSVANNNMTNKNQFDQASTSLELSKITWQEVRQLLPACWADILEQHVKSRHPDEHLLLKKPDGATSNIPTVYCCAAPKP